MRGPKNEGRPSERPSPSKKVEFADACGPGPTFGRLHYAILAAVALASGCTFRLQRPAPDALDRCRAEMPDGYELAAALLVVDGDGDVIRRCYAYPKVPKVPACPDDKPCPVGHAL